MSARSKQPPEAEDVWRYLGARHGRDAADRRAEIEQRVEILANGGRDPVGVYRALRAGTAILTAHERRKRYLGAGRVVVAHSGASERPSIERLQKLRRGTRPGV